MIRVITVSREYGSGGGHIARLVAQRLGWKLVDDPLVKELAKAANVNADLAKQYDECVDPWFHRLFKSIWRGGFEGIATSISGGGFDADAMAELWHRAIKEAAEIAECVIVGRGGQCLLQNREDAFHVSVYAPLELKIHFLTERVRPGTDMEALTREVDARRAAYIRRYFGQDWTNRHLYHLMICSEIGLGPAAQAILCAAGVHDSVKEL